MKTHIVTLLMTMIVCITVAATTTRAEESVTKRPLEQITGLVIPDGLPERVEQQETEAAIVERAYAAHLNDPLLKSTADAEKKQIVAGLGVPNLAALAEAKSSVSTDALKQAVAAAGKPPRLTDPKAPRFDLREIDVVADVRDQRRCGSCWPLQFQVVRSTNGYLPMTDRWCLNTIY
jgi:C1A family cysteine protease